MTALPPEKRAREQIDAQLGASGWVVQDYKEVDFSAGRGIALREVPLKTGPCDYLLLVDRIAVGVVEAKKAGTTLSKVAEQSARYATSLPDFLAHGLTRPRFRSSTSRPASRRSFATRATRPALATRLRVPSP